MGEHFCEYTVGYSYEMAPLVCDKPASIKHEGEWYCAEHYDAMEASFVRASTHGDPTFWGCDLGMGDDTGFYEYEFGIDPLEPPEK